MEERKMKEGILYVVYNKWINNPDTHEKPFKIGITENSVEERYYGLGLKMPGDFETLFAYILDNYKEAEKSIRDLLMNYHLNGEWFKITDKELDLVKNFCVSKGGKLVTDEIKNEIKMETAAIADKNKELADLFVKILTEYKDKGISIVWDTKSYIYWVTEKMDDFFPPGEENTGSSKDGRKYHYLYDVRFRSVYLELCPYKQDSETLDKMNKNITGDTVTSEDKYRRTNSKKLYFNKDYSNADNKIRSAIDYLLDVENRIINVTQ
jgi:hypothetical protein